MSQSVKYEFYSVDVYCITILETEDTLAHSFRFTEVYFLFLGPKNDVILVWAGSGG